MKKKNNSNGYPKGPKVSGKDYAAAMESYNKMMQYCPKPQGIAQAFKMAKYGRPPLPGIKPQRKK